MSSPDQLQHFLFSNADIRGQLVGLETCYQEALANHHYPAIIQELIGEFMAAATLLSGTLKLEGTLSIQAQGKGNLSLIMAECRNNQEVRAIARCDEETPLPARLDDLEELLGEGRLVITINPDGGQRYQGIVPLEGHSLARCLEAYFAQSEQLNTRIWLSATAGEDAAGLLLQALPSTTGAADDDSWTRVCLLTDTLSDTELRSLQNVALIYRLYHQEEVNLFPPSPVIFRCSCSSERTISALVSLGEEELETLLAEQDSIEVKCEFCHKNYRFNRDDLAPYRMEQDITEIANDLSSSRTLH